MVTKKKTETKINESTSSTEQSTPDTRVDDLVELSHKFADEIQNIMTVEHLSFTNRAKALGTATKYFTQQVDSISSE